MALDAQACGAPPPLPLLRLLTRPLCAALALLREVFQPSSPRAASRHQGVSNYLKEHDIEAVISDAVLDAVTAKAADPLLHIADFLTRLSKQKQAKLAGGSLNKLQLENVDVKGKRVLIRCDFNVPQDKKDPSVITNNARMCVAK
eukprot:scaffold29917_cov36-Tisochrysis_lutea.AAC.4